MYYKLKYYKIKITCCCSLSLSSLLSSKSFNQLESLYSQTFKLSVGYIFGFFRNKSISFKVSQITFFVIRGFGLNFSVYPNTPWYELLISSQGTFTWPS